MAESDPRFALSRRALLGFGAGAALLPLLAACSSAAPAPAVTSGAVNVPVWSNAPDFTKFFAKRAAALSKSGRFKYTISQLQSDADDIVTKAIAAYSVNGNMPGLLGVEITSFSRFLKSHIAADTLLDLSGEMGAPRDAFFAARVDPYVDQNKIYAMESQFPLITLYKRTDIWEQLNIPTTDTWDDYLRVGGKIANKHGVSLGVLATGDPTWFLMLLQQRGGHYYEKDGTLGVESPEAIDALQVLINGVKNGTFALVSDFYGGPGTSLLKQNKVAAYFMPDWFKTFVLEANAPDQKGKWQIAPLPRFAAGGHSTSVFGGTGFAVSKNSSARDAALKLLQDAYGTQDGQVDRFKTTGYLPTLKSAWDAPEVLSKTDDYLSGQKVMDIYKPLSTDAPTQYQNPNWSIANAEVGTAVGAALSGRQSAAEALKGAADRIRQQTQ